MHNGAETNPEGETMRMYVCMYLSIYLRRAERDHSGEWQDLINAQSSGKQTRQMARPSEAGRFFQVLSVFSRPWHWLCRGHIASKGRGQGKLKSIKPGWDQ